MKRGYRDKTLLPNIVFDPQSYRERNSIEFSGPELTHYCLAGDREGYITHPLFNAKVYNEARTDELPRITAIEHFLGIQARTETCEPSQYRAAIAARDD